MAHGDKSNGIQIAFEASYCLHARSVWAQCSLCVDSCPSGCLHVEDNSALPVLDEERCLNCGQCLSACPLDAFSSPNFSERQLLNRVSHDGPVRLRCFLPYGEAEIYQGDNDFDLEDEYHLGTCLASITSGGLFELAFARPCTLQNARCTNCQLFERVGKTLQCNEEQAYSLLGEWGRESNLREQVSMFLPTWDDVLGGTATHGEELRPDAKNGGQDQGNNLGDGLSNGLQNRFDAFNLYENWSGSSTQLSYAFADVAQDTVASAEKACNMEESLPEPPLAENVKSSIRALFHGHRRKRPHRGRDNRIVLGKTKLQMKHRHVPGWRLRLEEFWRTHSSTPAHTYPWPEQIVDEHVCRACGVCMQLCPTGSIHQRLEDGMFTYTHNPGICTNCGLCIVSCPAQALSRGYQNMDRPFSAQTRMRWPASTCVRCGLPVRLGTGDLCILCQMRPDEKAVAKRIRKHMVAWLNSESPAAAKGSLSQEQQVQKSVNATQQARSVATEEANKSKGSAKNINGIEDEGN